jgi:hypothetical protein
MIDDGADDASLDDAPIVLPIEEAPAPAPAKVGQRGGAWVAPEGYVGAPEAEKIWVEMGKGRTIKRVMQEMAALKRPMPSLATVKKWSQKHNWKDKARQYDLELAMAADERIKAQRAAKGAKQLVDLATEFRGTAKKLIARLNARIAHIKVKSGGEAKAIAEAAVSLNRAAEVLDGGVGDRTEHRETLTIEEREQAAASMVDDVFKQLRTNKGNDNRPDDADAVGDAADARRSAS